MIHAIAVGRVVFLLESRQRVAGMATMMSQRLDARENAGTKMVGGRQR